MSDIQPVQPQKTPTGTFQQIKEGALGVVHWIGRQIIWIGTTTRDLAAKIATFVGPFFQSMYRLLATSLNITKDFVIQHKEVFFLAPFILAIGIMIGCRMQCKGASSSA